MSGKRKGESEGKVFPDFAEIYIFNNDNSNQPNKINKWLRRKLFQNYCVNLSISSLGLNYFELVLGALILHHLLVVVFNRITVYTLNTYSQLKSVVKHSTWHLNWIMLENTAVNGIQYIQTAYLLQLQSTTFPVFNLPIAATLTVWTHVWRLSCLMIY